MTTNQVLDHEQEVFVSEASFELDGLETVNEEMDVEQNDFVDMSNIEMRLLVMSWWPIQQHVEHNTLQDMRNIELKVSQEHHINNRNDEDIPKSPLELYEGQCKRYDRLCCTTVDHR